MHSALATFVADVATVKTHVRRAIDSTSGELVALAKALYERPEIAFEEVQAAASIADFLGDHQFIVERGVYGIPTAFVASLGDGPSRVALCAEYDALPAGVDREGHERADLSHACGHHLIAGASVGAAIGLRDILDELGLTLLVIGTPAEELLGLTETPPGRFSAGKTALLTAGAFDNVHAALMAHPCPSPFSMFLPTKACFRIRAELARPEPVPGLDKRIRQTLDALGQTAFLYRDHPQSEGGPPVVDIGWFAHTLAEGNAAARALRTALRTANLNAAALTEFAPYAEMRNDPDLARLYRDNARALGRERETSRRVQNEVYLLEQLYPDTQLEDVGLFLDKPPIDFPGGTDMGTISQTIAAIHPFFGIGGLAFNHSPDFTLQANRDDAYRAMINASTALAWTVADHCTALDPKT